MKYTAPEVIASTFNSEYNSGPKVDVWSLGIILAELIFAKELWPALKLGQYLRKVLSFIYCDNVLSRFARETDSFEVYQVIYDAFLLTDGISNFLISYTSIQGYECGFKRFSRILFTRKPWKTSNARNFIKTQDFRFV